MDEIDKQILTILQNDTTLPLTTIAKKVNLSTTPCFNRIKKLEEDGVIKKRVALLDSKKVNLPVIVYLTIRVKQHNREELDSFTSKITNFDEVVEMYRLTGESDYVLKVVTTSIEEYDKFNQKLIREISFENLNSYIVLKELKNTTVLPLNHLKK
tara:strand:+ start:699 stop:1163 length:465 start_codon:yes stop_codon:yes gene_type:complete